jgi:hypothetical protein
VKQKGDNIAPDGYVWVCLACGKHVKDKYGERGSGWDESCMLNSVLVPADRLVLASDGRVHEIREQEKKSGGDTEAV